MIFVTDYREFIAFIDECNAHYRTLLEFEYRKLTLIHEDNIDELSRALSEEQALVMKSNVLEKKRAEILAPEDAGKTFRELIEAAPEEYKARLTESCEELTAVIRKIKDINDNAAAIINARLKKIQKNRDELETYNMKGGVSHTDGSVRTTTFNA